MTTLPAHRFARGATVAALLVTGAALPAAQPKQGSAREAAPQASASAQSRNADRREICVRMEQSGTRLRRRVCRTAEEWQAEEGGVPTGR